jgi:hypothetical protein
MYNNYRPKSNDADYYDLSFNNFLLETFVNNDTLNDYRRQNEEYSCNRPSSSNEEIQLLAQQKFVQKYIRQDTPFRGLLLWHGLGSGKTISAVSILNNYRDKENKKKIIILPASLAGNFRKDYQVCGYDAITQNIQCFESIDTMDDETLENNDSDLYSENSFIIGGAIKRKLE